MPDINATLHTNFAKLGFYSDQLSLSQATVSRQMIDRFAQDGYGGVLFEITVGVSTDGSLQHDLTYQELFSLLDYANSKGLKTGVLPNWTFNGGNASYVGQTSTGQTRPTEFKIEKMLNSIKEFSKEFLKNGEAHGLDLYYLSQCNPDFFVQDYRDFWIGAIQEFRASFSGALSNQVWSTGKFISESLIDLSAIWDQLDGIGLWAKPYIAEEPIYDIDTIVSGYFGSKLNGRSMVNEIVAASLKYKKPILLTANAFSLPNALDGGWDPTAEQAMQKPLPLNPNLQKLAFESLFQLIANNLSSMVTSVAIGNYEPWSYNDYSQAKPSATVSEADIAIFQTFKYFDLSLFPSLAEDTIKTYLSDPLHFRISNLTMGSTGNDVIYALSGNNDIYLSGGYDTVTAGSGNDAVHVAVLSQKNLKFEYGVWITNAVDALNSVNIDLGNQQQYTIKFAPTKTPVNSNGYWDKNFVDLNLPADVQLNQLVFTLSSGGFAKIGNLQVNGIMVNPSAGIHTKVESWSYPDWIVSQDKFSFDLRKLIVQNNLDNATSIDGGPGTDKVYFGNAQPKSNFNISIQPSQINVTDPAGQYPNTSLVNVERLIFSDTSIALDVEGKAGIVAKILGAVFGKDSVGNKKYVGIGLSFLDAGWTYDQLASLALDAALANTNDKIVSLLWKNVIGSQPTTADKALYIAMLENGLTAGALAHLAADSSFNTTNINLVGLAQAGIEYIPI
ncbi:MAG: hypothetical protein WAO82_02745 [Limnohabitans sp.]|jgi:hypothetical protein